MPALPFPGIFDLLAKRLIAPRMSMRKAVAFAAGIGLSVLSCPGHAAPFGGVADLTVPGVLALGLVMIPNHPLHVARESNECTRATRPR